jgi:2-amino-4-hydroxy-6-hydroxymethyldihydropteridine diphosphokinase
MTNRVYISLGSNINKERNLPAAVQLLGKLCHVLTCSAVYETAPVGLENQPRFFNAAVLIETKNDAASFSKDILARVEKRLERVRTIDKNAPRTIDLDITLFNQEVFDLDSTHHIPDPDLLRQPHVAVPIAELSPALPHPETGEELAQIAARLVQESAQSGAIPLVKRTDIILNINKHVDGRID